MTNELKTYSAHIFELGCMNQQVYLKFEADKELRRQKYKRCLAMAKWCDAEADVADADGDYEDMRWYQKWHCRWLDLAEKFKEAENGNSKRAD